MVEVICDTSFLIHLANNRIKNLESIETEIGSVTFVVPDTVISELRRLAQTPEKHDVATSTLNYIKSFKTKSLGGSFADSQFILHVRKQGGVVATLDKELKRQIKKIRRVCDLHIK